MLFTASPHTHPESPISGSTVESMIDKAVSLGRTHFSYTDPGYMTSLYRGYKYALKKGLKFIPGLEIFIKDPNCPYVKGSVAEKSSYFKITLYATNQEQYGFLSKLSSKETNIKISHYGETYNAFGWKEIEEAASKGLLAVSSDVHDIVGKHLLTNTPQIGQKIFLKLKELFGENYSVSIIGNKIDKSWVSLVHFKLQDGTEDFVLSTSKVSTNAARMAKALEIVENPKKHSYLKSYRKNYITIKIGDPGKKITKADLHNGFISLKEGDIQLKINMFMYSLANRYGVRILYSDYSFYASPEDKTVQDVRLSQEDIKEHTKRHMQTSEEAIAYLKGMGLSEDKASAILKSNAEWATKFNNFGIKTTYRLPSVEDNKNALELCVEHIKALGRLPNDPRYIDRLRYEISVLSKNGKIDLIPYFLPIRDVLDHYKKNKRITGPGRGSAGGSLFLYLMGITQVDPIKYDLSFERFLSLDRVLNGDLPDVDVDLVDREPLVGPDGLSGYLYSRWGTKAAQISTRIQLRLKSSIKDVNRYLHGKVEPEIEKLSKSLPPPPQGINDQDFTFGFEDSDGNHIPGLIETNTDLQKYAESRPREWELVKRCLGISRQNSKHASAFIISDSDIQETIPTFMGNTTQFEAKAVEELGFIKYDFLKVNQLQDIELCISYINKKHNKALNAGYFWKDGKELYIWDLPEEKEVFESIWSGDTSTLFQINTQSMVPFVKKIRPNSINDLSTILALVRPGPLDFIDPDTGISMADEYVERRNGRGTIKIKEILDLLPETYGVMCYQEQVSKISKELGGMSATDAENLRRLFSKKQKAKALAMKPVFMKNAIKKVDPGIAEAIWQQMETFSRYGFNKSHSTAYAMITYACMYLKHHYPLEWWAAVLSNADEQEITTNLYKHIEELVVPPDINESSEVMTIDYERKKIRAKLSVMKGIGDKIIKPIVDNRPYIDLKDFVSKKVAGPSITRKLIHVGVMDSFFKPEMTLLEKMQTYEDTVELCEYEEKVKLGKKVKELKKGKIQDEYLSLSPFDDFKVKKSIFPTMPLNLTDLVKKYSKLLDEGNSGKIKYSRRNGGDAYPLISGKDMEILEKKLPIDKDLSFCVPAYIIKVDEFWYSNDTKKALKIHVDIDSKISERVMWPPYGGNEPSYPKNLSKNMIVLLFFKVKEDRPSLNLIDIKIVS